MEPCRFFAQGRCAFGTACRLSHALPAGGTAGWRPPAPPLPEQDSSGAPSGMLLWQAAASEWGEEVSAETREVETREVRKEVLKLRKAMREIEALEERRAGGQSMLSNQLRKIEKKVEYTKRLDELEESLRLQGQPEPAVASTSPPVAASVPVLAAAMPVLAQPQQSVAAASRGAVTSQASRAGTGSSVPVCRHFLTGRCSFGDSCRHSHTVSGDNKLAQGRRRPDLCFDVDDPECGICFESILKKGERFGILESCDHAFCLNCIRSWRKQREQQDRQNLRLCPVCRNESFFIVPSDTLLLEPVEKGQAIAAYKAEMGRIPCKAFDYGKGKCPFGSSCFYAHLNPDGTRFVPAALRWRNGADGSEVIGEVKLSDFLARSLALS